MMNGTVMMGQNQTRGEENPRHKPGPWKSGRNPSVCFRNGSIYRRIKGTSVKIASRP